MYSLAMRLQVVTVLATIVSLTLLPGITAQAADSVPIERAIADFLRAQIKDLPGEASFSIGPIHAGGLTDGCRNISTTMEPGAPAWGRTHVNVRCTEGAAWNLYVPVQINVVADYLVSTRALRPGQVITEADIGRHRGNLANLPASILTDPIQAIGQSTRIALPADRPLRADMLRPATVVKQGQNVKIVAGGTGFQVSSEGRALNNAAAGQVVQVRLASGQVVSGIARADGSIEITN